MKSSFNPLTGEWEMDWPGRVARHDLVYASPPADPMQGIPLGNGDTGALAWCEESRLVFAMNKCDLWDDAGSGVFHNWKPEEEERSTTLRHAGRLVLDFHLPVFDIRYLSDFKARLSLADARMSLRATGPFGTVGCEAFIAWEEGLLWLSVETALVEEAPLTIRVERFGSRTFSHWYALVNRDARIGLSGTQAYAEEGWACVSQAISSGTFAFGCRLEEAGVLRATSRREHSHAAAIELSRAQEKRITLAAAVSSPVTGSAPSLLRSAIDRGIGTGREAAFAAHRQAWQSFWLRRVFPRWWWASRCAICTPRWKW
jgi:alpha-L-fucosidase 2